MNVLLTGDSGRLGVVARGVLEGAGHDVRGFDASRGDDVLDAAAVRAAADGVDAIVHLAGMADDRAGADDAVMQVNVAGTWNVLLAAEACGVGRVVYASSGKAIGMLERDPPYLPLDDAAPGLPGSTYGLSKWLSEEMCASFSARTGISTLCLRPVLVLDDDGWSKFSSFDELPPARGKAWHLAVFVDARDVADAVLRAVTVADPPSHARMLLCADEVASERSAAELIAEKLPDLVWRGPAPQGRVALLDCSAAFDVLGWRPRVGWDERLRHRAGASRAGSG